MAHPCAPFTTITYVKEQLHRYQILSSSSSLEGHARQQLLQSGVNTLILILWLWLYRPVFSYLHVIFQREDFRTNQIVLIGVILLIAWQMHRDGVRPNLSATPHLHWPALTLVFGGSILFLLVERFLDINMAAACLFALASYGLLGLWLSPQRWRQGLPAMLLLIGVLPFGEHLQTFVGYPLRILTAELVRNGLAAAGVASLGVDTILVFENGVSHVDLPCSGVKSLWTGMLFLLAATWIEQRPLTPTWFLIALLLLPVLFLANLLRVALLVIVGQVLTLPLLAEMLHVPLGVLGFGLVCATAVALLKWRKPHHQTAVPQSSDVGEPAPGFNQRRFRLSATLIIFIAVMILLYAPRPLTGLSSQAKTWVFAEKLQIEPLPLKPDENEWLTRDGAESADRLRFTWGDVSGSMILISSKTWRAHHRPERCFEVYGLSLDDSHTHLVNPAMPIRFVALSDSGQSRQYSASYWFQSTGQTTDDYGTRIWSDVAWEREHWVLVSILFDGRVNPNEPEIEMLYLALHDATAAYLSN